jgi:hypothetical protein
LSRTWKLAPHPSLALVYAFAKPGESRRDRLNRIKHLARPGAGDIEGHITVANAAIEAHEWQEARARFEPYLADRPPRASALMMARISRVSSAIPAASENGLAAHCAARRARGSQTTAIYPTAGCGLPGPGGRCLRMEGGHGRCHRPRRHTLIIEGPARKLPARPAQVAPPLAARRAAAPHRNCRVGRVEAALPEPSAAKRPKPPKRRREASPALYVPIVRRRSGVVQADPDESPTSLGVCGRRKIR